ncbi:MAG TPA: ABC transporter permease, partial [Gaiellaceae bacterium]|nr:ABC transporter permease [Gaiellaceae bacterium]
MTRFALVSLLRAPLRTLVRIVVLALAAALLGAMILFVSHSLRTMTASAVRSVPLDWQAPLASRPAAERIARRVARQPGIAEAVPVATAPFAGAVHRASVGTIRSGAGSIVAVPPGYLRRLYTFRFLRGRLRAGGIVLDQQLAATLRAAVGDVVTLTLRPNAKPVALPVTGVALVTAPDVLFQPLNPYTGPAPAQPPADIAILPIGTFAQRIAPELPTVL